MGDRDVDTAVPKVPDVPLDRESSTTLQPLLRRLRRHCPTAPTILRIAYGQETPEGAGSHRPPPSRSRTHSLRDLWIGTVDGPAATHKRMAKQGSSVQRKRLPPSISQSL